MTSPKKIASNRRNARKGGRPSRRQDEATDKLMAEILARADAKTARLAARKLLKRLGEIVDTPTATAPATPTTVAKATDDVDSLVGQLLEYAGAKTLADVEWKAVYEFAKLRELEGDPIRTELFRRWQDTQPLPAIDF